MHSVIVIGDPASGHPFGANPLLGLLPPMLQQLQKGRIPGFPIIPPAWNFNLGLVADN